jgi:YjbE family integral membrane protein
MEAALQYLTAFAAIIVINLMLSGDNAIVIALAARGLPERLQLRAIVYGTAGAVVVRIAMTLAVVRLLQIPGLLFAGGVALIWIGYKLLIPDEDALDPGSDSNGKKGVWSAVRTIVVADMAMGVDNVIGVAGAAQGSYLLVVLGLVTSIPIVVWGSTWLLKWVERHPAIVYVGAGVLLWTAAKMIAAEPLAQGALDRTVLVVLLYVSVVCGVLWAGFLRNHRHLESRIHARLAQLSAARSTDPSQSPGGPMSVVLVPISDLANSHHAVERVAAEFPRNPAMQVHLLNVRKPLSRRVSGFVRPSLREDYHRERADIALAPARAILERHRIPFEQHVRVGDPGTLIADEAKRLGCDRIVMCTARRGSITRIVEDTTTERVLQLTTVPVELIVSDAVSSLERWAVPAVVVAALATLVYFVVAAD